MSQNTFGIRSGLFFAKMRYFADDEYLWSSDPINKLEIGVFTSFKLTKIISFMPEVNYLHKGGAIPDNPNPPKTYYQQIELALPFNFEYSFDKIALFGKIGPSYGYMIGGYNEISSIGRGLIEFKDNSDYVRSDLGFLAGGGISFLISESGKISLESRYRRSFIYTRDEELEDFKYSTKNFGWGIVVGYSTNLFNRSK